MEKEDKKLNDKSSPSFGQRGATLINESGLYALIFSSKKEFIIDWKNFKAFVNVDKGYFGRRNLSPIQRIAVAEKYRPIYEEQAKRNLSLAGGDKKSPLSTLTKAINEEESINVREKLAKKASVGTGTYSKGKKSPSANSPKAVTLSTNTITNQKGENNHGKNQRNHSRGISKNI